MNETLIKYLAGLLDADGSLSFTFKHDQNREGLCFIGLMMQLASSTAVDKLGFIDSLPTLTGMGTFHLSGDNDQFKSWKVSKRADLEMLLPRLIKHMVIKAKHWNWLLNMWRTIRIDRGTISLQEREILTQASKESRRLNSGPLKPKNHPTWAWLAGYIDGDGCYSHRLHVHNISAVAHINDIEVLYFIQRAFGGRIENQGQSDNVYIWRRGLGYRDRSFALKFLPNLAKHSKLKRIKIDAMIHHHQQRLSVPGTEKTFCTICNSPAHGNRLCRKHYQQQRRENVKV